MIPRRRNLERVFIGVAALILVYQLFVSPMVGMANTGDFGRVTGWFGLDYTGNDMAACKYLFVNRVFTWTHKIEPHYPSSGLLLLGAALAENAVLHSRSLFDIRFLGSVYVASYLLVLLLLTMFVRTLSLRTRLLIYALTTFIFLDLGYVAYFNSFFSEPASLVFLGATVALALIAANTDPAARRAWLPVAGFFVAAFLFGTAKVQNATSAIPLAFVGYSLVRMHARPDETGGKRHRFLALALAGLLVLGFLGYFRTYSIVSRRIYKEVLFLNVFHEILARSYTPEQDLAEMGLDPSLVFLKGSTYPSPDVPQWLVDALPSKLGYSGILKFYVRHPDRYMELAEDAAGSTFDLRPDYIGNFERSYGAREGFPPADQRYDLPSEYLARKFSLWSSLKEQIPSSLGLIVAFMGLNVLAIAAKRWRYDRSPRDRMVTGLHATLLVMAAMQFQIVILGEGLYEIAKHLFLFDLLCEICLVFLIVYLANVKAILRSKKIQA